MALSKKLRFEVFKRDSFTCQYCGNPAPDVILHVDHIEPKSKGGKNDIMNLITSCQGCNLGKSDRKLNDDAVITKKKKQLDSLNDRREQLKMMMQWQDDLLDIEQQQLDYVDKLWSKLLLEQYSLSEIGIKNIKILLNRFGFNKIVEAMKVAVAQYIKTSSHGNIDKDSVGFAFEKIGGIAFVKKQASEDGHFSTAFHISKILIKKFTWLDDWKIRPPILKALNLGANKATLLDMARNCPNISDWNSAISNIITELEDG